VTGQPVRMDPYSNVWDMGVGGEDDPYTISFEEIRFKLRLEHDFAIRDHRAVMMPITWISDLIVGADGEEARGNRATAARMRSETAIREFHRRPSWRLWWLAVKWAVLAEFRHDGEVICVAFDAGKRLPDVSRQRSRR
jgi:hypothetical protein